MESEVCLTNLIHWIMTFFFYQQGPVHYLYYHVIIFKITDNSPETMLSSCDALQVREPPNTSLFVLHNVSRGMTW